MSGDQVEVFCDGRQSKSHREYKVMTLRRNALVFQGKHGRYAVEVIDYDNGPQLEPITGDDGLFYDLLPAGDPGPAWPGVAAPRPWEPMRFAPPRERRRYEVDLVADLARIQAERAAGMAPEHRGVEPPRTAFDGHPAPDEREFKGRWIERQRKMRGRRIEDVVRRDEHGNLYRCGLRYLFDLHCPKCGLGVQVKEHRFYPVLDKLADAGLTRASLTRLSGIFGAG